MKYIITVPEDSVLPDVLELLAEQGVIELEEVVEQKKPSVGIGIVAVDVTTGEQLEFNSIKEASQELGCYPGKIAQVLDKKEMFYGYYWYKLPSSQKRSKIKI